MTFCLAQTPYLLTNNNICKNNGKLVAIPILKIYQKSKETVCFWQRSSSVRCERRVLRWKNTCSFFTSRGRRDCQRQLSCGPWWWAWEGKPRPRSSRGLDYGGDKEIPPLYSLQSSCSCRKDCDYIWEKAPVCFNSQLFDHIFILMCALLAFLLSFGNKLLSFSNLFLPIRDNSLQKWAFIRNFVPSFAHSAPAKGLSSHLKTHKSHHHNLINTHTLLDRE